MSGTGHIFGPRWPRKPFALTTGDPAFDPAEPVTVNGYAFAPVLVEDDDVGATIDG